ncbi:MAG: cytochrome c [Hyphomicrobiaceae bacterium]
MIRILSVVAAIAVGATAVYAQSAAIGQRKEVLKTFGGAMKDPSGMMKGEVPFDLAKVQASLKTLADGAPKLPALFPDDSKTGGETQALPVIWEKKAEFVGGFKKLEADAKTAAGAIKDEASFKTEWPKIGANCGACHKAFRQPPKS